MRYLTPDVDVILGTFRRTHERRFDGAAPRWELVGWPRTGGLEEQDAWTIEALQFARDVMNNLEAQTHAAPTMSEPVTLEAVGDGD